MRTIITLMLLGLVIPAQASNEPCSGHSGHSAPASRTGRSGNQGHAAHSARTGAADSAASNSDENSVARDANRKIKRSSSARHAFQREHPCPSTGQARGACPGYVIDHINPLKRGGADAPANMQWQTREAAKEKDKWE